MALNIVGRADLFALLQQQLLINERQDDLRLPLGDFGLGLFLCQAGLLLERLLGLLQLTLQHRERYDLIIHLRDHFVHHTRRALFLRADRRNGQCRQHGQAKHKRAHAH